MTARRDGRSLPKSSENPHAEECPPAIRKNMQAMDHTQTEQPTIAYTADKGAAGRQPTG
jgi:hypothetical protein